MSIHFTVLSSLCPKSDKPSIIIMLRPQNVLHPLCKTST